MATRRAPARRTAARRPMLRRNTAPLPSWAKPIDGESGIELAFMLYPHIKWSRVEDSREPIAFAIAMADAFARKHANTDWDEEDYMLAVEDFANYYVANAPHTPEWLGD